MWSAFPGNAVELVLDDAEDGWGAGAGAGAGVHAARRTSAMAAERRFMETGEENSLTRRP